MRLALLAVVLVAGCGGGAGTSQASASPQEMQLRLADLPRGFKYGDDAACGQVGTTEGSDPKLDKFLVETRPEACFGEFYRAWGAAMGVDTALFVFGDEDDAARAWKLRNALFSSFSSIFITAEHGSGDAVTFDSRGLNRPGAGEAWRDGRLVVAVYDEGLSRDEGRAFAHTLAAKQRERIASPSPPVQEDDREVELDDPSVDIPIYWLGKTFDPPGLPALELYSADYYAGGDERGSGARIEYEGGVNLDLMTPAAWKRYKRTRLGRLIWAKPCARHSALALEGRRADIYGTCRGAPEHWIAHVYYPDIVVAVNIPVCYSCVGRPSDPYNSRNGMEAVVRGLERR